MDAAITIRNLSTAIAGKTIHQALNLTVERGEILALIGGSGSGKTVLLREMMALMKPTAGTIEVLDQHLGQLTPTERTALQSRFGVLFQQNALFSSLSIIDNVAFPLEEQTDLDPSIIRQLALLKMILAGLKPETALLYPAELSGGMQKRAALARAIVMDPELLFLDEPTAGLDPGLVAAFDKLILNLQQSLGLTVVLVTHDVQSVRRTATRVAFLGEGRVLCVGTLEEVKRFPHPLVHDYFMEQ